MRSIRRFVSTLVVLLAVATLSVPYTSSAFARATRPLPVASSTIERLPRGIRKIARVVKGILAPTDDSLAIPRP